MKKSTIDKILKLYEIGTSFIIINDPDEWSSALNKNSPIRSNIKYPYHGKIVNIEYISSHFAIDDGIYGWSLSTLISKKLIINVKKQRKLKLKKINQSYDKKHKNNT